MESKSCQQKNAMISLARTKHKTLLPEKKNTWSNLLNKNSISTNSVIISKKKPKQSSPIPERVTSKISKSIQCDLSNNKLFQSSALSVINPIRTLQFLLKEMIELPSVQNTDITKIINEMQAVVGRIIDECSENVPYLHVPVMNDNFMIPTRENEYCNDLKYENNFQGNKYWLILLEKISELENNYGQLTKNYTKSEEKLMYMTSERDELLEKFKKLCDSLEILNNREREYLDTITELKTKLMDSEKLISKQEAIIKNLNKRLNNLPNKSEELVIENKSIEQHNYKTVLKENNELKQNLDTSKVANHFDDTDIFKLKLNINQMKQIMMLSGLENPDVKSVSMTSLKSEENLLKNFTKYSEENKKYIEHDIDTQYTEYNRQASVIKMAKTELHELFETIKIQANLSKKLFNSSTVDNKRNLNDISDDEDKCSNVTNCTSIVTNSSI